MARNGDSGWRGVEQWLSESLAEAERLLPRLLELPTPVLHDEVRARPELRTPGMMQRLIGVAQNALDRYPRQAWELSCIVVEFAPSIEVPRPRILVARRIEAQGWMVHARALRGIGRLAAAAAAVARARELFARTPAHNWSLATLDLLEAQILHELDGPAEALPLVRRASVQLALCNDHDRYLQARMTEAWILWSGGEREAATAVWQVTAELAAGRGDHTLLANLERKIGDFELRHGRAEDAARLLASALATFADAGMTRDVVRVRWSLAEAAAARGRVNEAISEFYKVRAELLATGDSFVQAALASAEILDLLLLAGREEEAAKLAGILVPGFRDRLGTNALQAFTYLLARAERGELARSDVAAVRRYFEDFPQQPNAWFRGPV